METKTEQQTQKHSRVEMLMLYTKALTSIELSNNVNVSVNAAVRFQNNQTDFNITVFDSENTDNLTFHFFDTDLKTTEEMITSLNKTLNLIRTDDFLKIKAGYSVDY